MKKQSIVFVAFWLLLLISSCGSETEQETTKEGNISEEENQGKEQSEREEGEIAEETGDEQGSAVKEFTVQAIRFAFTPNIITVQEGDEVHIIIENLDATHGMKIPELGVNGDTSVEFVATKAGEFEWFCNNFCGSGHSSMSGTLVVENK